MMVAFVMVLAGTALAAPEITIKFAGQNPADHPATEVMNQIAAEVLEKSKGRIEIKVFPANQLGDYTLVFEELIRGTIEMACISVPSQFDPRLELVYINGFVRGYEDVKKVFAPDAWLFGRMHEMIDRLGVELLGFFIEGMIGTGTTKPAVDPLNPAVPKDVLVRVPNMDVYKLAAEAMGYRTVTIPYADVYQSMQTGVCEGVNGYPVAAAYTALRDVLKHWYMTNYSLECLNIMFSGKAWDSLKPEDQQIIRDAVNRGAAKSIEMAEEIDAKYMQMMRDYGIEVHTYTEEELTPLAEACATTWTQLEKNMTKELMDEFRANMAPGK
ncbi:MAG: TRAP transporter substrate-binding protein DctP [Synergistaceae bacterium]|nr:TRAP transporter substrate-binding protein DctP [Synergistaceae bacterium]